MKPPTSPLVIVDANEQSLLLQEYDMGSIDGDRAYYLVTVEPGDERYATLKLSKLEPKEIK